VIIGTAPPYGMVEACGVIVSGAVVTMTDPST
jgi:hypothetical protein